MPRGKEKGNEYERSVCKELTFWISGQKKDLLFWRSTTSGGHYTITKSVKSQVGDIAVIADPTDSYFKDACWFLSKYTIECKHVKPVKMQLGHTTEMEKLWMQAVDQARSIDKEPMLFMKFNNRKQLLGVSEKVGKRLQKKLKVYSYYSFETLEPVAFFLKDEVFSLEFKDFKKI